MKEFGKRRFSVEYLKEASDFIRNTDAKTSRKIIKTIDYASQTQDPQKFKKIVNTEIWEFRIECNKLQYRILSFWDYTKNAVIIATHGFIKKTQKTPHSEIVRAENISRQYFNEK